MFFYFSYFDFCFIQPEVQKKVVVKNTNKGNKRVAAPSGPAAPRSAKAEEAARAREEARRKMMEDKRRMMKAKQSGDSDAIPVADAGEETVV